LVSVLCGAESVKTVFSFPADGSKGISANGPLVQDKAGNLYGTTVLGASTTFPGTIFKLSQGSGGVWTETVLYSFQSFNDGFEPLSGLLMDSAGNLYGTTRFGGSGTNPSCPPSGCGVVFELSPGANGAWAYSVIYNFDFTDGANPTGVLAIGAAGELYGTTQNGGPNGFGSHGCGLVFQLKTLLTGVWNQTVLHAFAGSDGAYPTSGVILDKVGNLYGTTSNGGGFSNSGVVFKLTPTGQTWKETAVHRFRPQNDGQFPNGPLLMDSSGNLYGTTNGGKSYPLGIVFRLSLVNAMWQETILHAFGAPLDSYAPNPGLLQDNSGNLFGTTYNEIFKLSPASSTPWTETVVNNPTPASCGQPIAWNLAHKAFFGESCTGATAAGSVFKVTLP
jgi:uncharacterized repeat protein (TIGR03803 family)